jgi:transcriptional regulator with XRE-family HTH domain
MSRGSKGIMGAQIRAGRALLRWTIADLADQSGVSLATIHRAEMANGKTAMTFANASAVRNAFEAGGVELLEENGGGPGARFKQRLSDDDSGRSPSRLVGGTTEPRRPK